MLFPICDTMHNQVWIRHKCVCWVHWGVYCMFHCGCVCLPACLWGPACARVSRSPLLMTLPVHLCVFNPRGWPCHRSPQAGNHMTGAKRPPSILELRWWAPSQWLISRSFPVVSTFTHPERHRCSVVIKPMSRRSSRGSHWDNGGNSTDRVFLVSN